MSEDHERLMRTVKGVVDEAGDLRKQLQFGSAHDVLRARRAKVDELRQRLQQVRARGFVYKAALETHLQEGASLAPGAAEDLGREARAVADRLGGRVDRLADRARPLVSDRDLRDRKNEIEVLESERRDLEGEVRDAERRLQAITDPVVRAVDAVDAGVREAEAVLDAFAEYAIALQPGEDPFAVVDASWEDAPGGAQKGKLLFTDARVRFVQDEVVTKGGFLGFGGEKTTHRKVQIDEPIGNLAKSEDTTRGWVFKDQVLALGWANGSRYRSTTFELGSGTAKDWDARIEALRDGSMNTDRVAGSSVRVEEVLRFVSKCDGCSAALPPPVKGQRTLVCPYCATTHQPL